MAKTGLIKPPEPLEIEMTQIDSDNLVVIPLDPVPSEQEQIREYGDADMDVTEKKDGLPTNVKILTPEDAGLAATITTAKPTRSPSCHLL
jgi:hypothetical protein